MAHGRSATDPTTREDIRVATCKDSCGLGPHPVGCRPPGAAQKPKRCAGQGMHRSIGSTLLESAVVVCVDVRGKDGVAGSTATATNKRTITAMHARWDGHPRRPRLTAACACVHREHLLPEHLLPVNVVQAWLW